MPYSLWICRGGIGRPPMYGGPRPGMAPLPGPGLPPDGFSLDGYPSHMPPIDFPEPLRYVDRIYVSEMSQNAYKETRSYIICTVIFRSTLSLNWIIML
jgi:hypothetical protein